MLEASSHTYKQRQVAIIVAQLRNTVKPIKNQLYSYNWNYNFPSFDHNKEEKRGRIRIRRKRKRKKKKNEEK